MAYSKYNTGRFQRDIPVKEGKEYDVVIEGIGEKGDGIAKIQGYVVIIPGVKKGDKVKIKVSAVRGKVSFGEVVGKATSEPAGEGESAGDEKEEAEESFSDEEGEAEEEVEAEIEETEEQ